MISGSSKLIIDNASGFDCNPISLKGNVLVSLGS